VAVSSEGVQGGEGTEGRHVHFYSAQLLRLLVLRGGLHVVPATSEYAASVQGCGRGRGRAGAALVVSSSAETWTGGLLNGLWWTHKGWWSTNAKPALPEGPAGLQHVIWTQKHIMHAMSIVGAALGHGNGRGEAA
jgi:hypothetical protein